VTLKELLARVAGAFHFGRREDELRREIEFHQSMLEQQHRERGLDAEAARRAARLDLGGGPQIAEAWRDQRGLPFIDALRQDLRYGLRMLRRSPGFSATAIVTLALGIGANTAIFTVVDAVLLRPLPYANPDRLVTVGDRNPDGSSANAAFGMMTAWSDRSRTLEGFAGMRPWTPTLVTAGEAERIEAIRVSWNYFDLLGVRPMIGRTFTADDDGVHEWPPYAIVSESLWRQRLGGDSSVVGRTVSLNGRDYRIVGVMPASFQALDSERFYNEAVQLWAPIGSYMKGDVAASGSCRACGHLKVLARLRPGATIATATAEMNALRGDAMAVVPLQRALTSDVRTALLVLLGAVGFVLLIACANVASLLLARSVTRQRELTLRVALGAGRARLVRQLLTESLLLASFGGGAGVLVASVGVRGLAALAPATLPRLDHAQVDARVLVFTALVTILTSIACGLLPAWRCLDDGGPERSALQRQRSHPGRTSQVRLGISHLRPGRARALLVVADLTFALVLLAGAGLMLRTVVALTRANPGFTADGVLSLKFALTGRAYASDAADVAFEQGVLERLRALPAVEATAVAGQVPFSGVENCWSFHAQGRMRPNPADDPCVELYSFAGDYFRALNVPVIAGRTFTDDDGADGGRVMLVSAATARLVWGSEDPIGAQVRIGALGAWRTVVGIVGDVHHDDLTTAPAPAMYLPESQMTSAYITLVAKARNGDAASLAPDVRAVLRALDPAVPIYSVSPLASLVRKSAAQRVFVMRILSAFAGVAVLLAAVGLYGLVAYSVAERTREVGVRVALGARRGDVVRLILSSGLWIVGAGVIAGLLAAAIGVRFLATLIFGVSPLDPPTLAAAAAILTIVALAAHWIPIRRALGIDPAIALRAE
jgi:putative ABC transport system permease protein